MSIANIIHIIAILIVLVGAAVIIWDLMTIKKEEMQAKFFLRYDYIRKAIIILIFALILQMFVHSPEFGSVGGYLHVAVDLITVLLVFMELYYFFKVEGRVT